MACAPPKYGMRPSQIWHAPLPNMARAPPKYGMRPSQIWQVVDGQHLVAGSLRRQAESDAASIEALSKSLP
eukprot:1178777-Prymnesium_polylepis.1